MNLGAPDSGLSLDLRLDMDLSPKHNAHLSDAPVP
jgi:hypothetical protein